ncbi:hypothetical protein L195_g025276, partial [Trifolium pratense]
IEYFGHMVIGQGVSMDKDGSSCVGLAYTKECETIEEISLSY